MATLRPAVAAYLDEAARSTTVPSGTSVEELRRHWDDFVVLSHRYVRQPAGGVEVTDLITAGGTAIRLYSPAGQEAGGRLHVHLHGGGWWMGSIETVDPMCRALAVDLQMTIASVDYPLAPEHPWPAALDAVTDVLAWAQERFSSISLGGESAGSNIAAACAIRARDTGGPRLVGLWLDVPVLDMRFPEGESWREFGSGYGIEVATLPQIVSWYVGAHSLDDPMISPSTADLTGLPPTLVTVAELDPLYEQGLSFAERLRDAGVEVDTRVAEGHIHGSSWLTGLDDYTREWHDSAVAALSACHVRELTA